MVSSTKLILLPEIEVLPPLRWRWQPHNAAGLLNNYCWQSLVNCLRISRHNTHHPASYIDLVLLLNMRKLSNLGGEISRCCCQQSNQLEIQSLTHECLYVTSTIMDQLKIRMSNDRCTVTRIEMGGIIGAAIVASQFASAFDHLCRHESG